MPYTEADISAFEVLIAQNEEQIEYFKGEIEKAREDVKEAESAPDPEPVEPDVPVAQPDPEPPAPELSGEVDTAAEYQAAQEEAAQVDAEAAKADEEAAIEAAREAEEADEKEAPKAKSKKASSKDE